jgi:hypothetical protein
VADDDGLFGKPLDRSLHPGTVLEVKLVGRLVEDDEFRAVDADGGKGRELQFPAGQLMWPTCAEIADAEAGKRFVDQPLDLAGIKPPRLWPERHVVADDRQDNLVAGVLEDEAGLGARRLLVDDGIEPVQRNFAGGGLGEPRDQPRKTRLAGAVEPDHADARLAKRQRQRLKRQAIAEAQLCLVETDVQGEGSPGAVGDPIDRR